MAAKSCPEFVVRKVILSELWQESCERHGTHQDNVVSKGPPTDHLAAKGCPGFVVEFDNYSINYNDPIAYLTLARSFAFP